MKKENQVYFCCLEHPSIFGNLDGSMSIFEGKNKQKNGSGTASSWFAAS